MQIKLGSLFDGIGGFPKTARDLGIKPVWASEIEAFPIKVTQHHFPNMVHLGDITKINGAEIEPVDIITGGSPCQDLSVAGKRAGLAGARSGLFMEQIRVIKEMRSNDESNGRTNESIRPKYMVWENVPGAFSSNQGEDFRAVLEEICRVKDNTLSVPMPVKGKWNKSGCIMGDGFSIAWRTIDAQFWGVPQRRRRIYLVADFGGDTAPEILFVEQGLSRDTQESKDKRWESNRLLRPPCDCDRMLRPRKSNRAAGEVLRVTDATGHAGTLRECSFSLHR
jgi:DNA (cytosine-5)-methyltransferase 1